MWVCIGLVVMVVLTALDSRSGFALTPRDRFSGPASPLSIQGGGRCDRSAKVSPAQTLRTHACT